MTVVAIDDTDSREDGMCTTYVAARVGARLEATGGGVARHLLVRLDPATEAKTRGNAAVALHADCDPGDALAAARAVVADCAVTGDDRTNPGVVVLPGAPGGMPAWTVDVATRAVRQHVPPGAVRRRLRDADVRHEAWGTGRGLVGATAAAGAWAAFDDWTYECLSYRERERWGTPRAVDADSVFAAADRHYPAVWDTVDRGTGEVVAVPRTPCPVLHGIRGDDPDAVRAAAAAVESEPVADRVLFVTNQGTDAHLQDAPPTDGRACRVTGEVVAEPETREGGHVFLALDAPDGRLPCAAFEPTRRFRDVVRALRPGDEVTACGEVGDGTLKLEKLAVRALRRTERRTPTCGDCGRRMESAGADQGYRCRDCGRTAPGKVEASLDRDLDVGWYEVPPRARRHVARPLVRGGFDAPVHPER